MGGIVLENGLAVLDFSRRATASFLEDIPDDKWCYAPVEGGNHTMWIVGHIAMTDVSLPSQLTGAEPQYPGDWQDLFGMGSKPKADPGVYPSPEQMRVHLNEMREGMRDWFKSMSEEELSSPLPEDWQRFAPNYGVLMCSLAWHEGMHAGQLSVIRRGLGIGPKFG